jgi:glycosyltransferase involved in cell wall biosynthesis
VRVAVLNLTAGGFSGGYRKYLRAVVPRLRADSRVEALHLLVPDAARASLSEALGEAEAFPAAEARSGFASARRAVEQLRPDVVFVPTARALGGLATPQVVMVRNMEPLEAPLAGLSPPAGLRNLARALEAKRACRRAARVVAVSQHVADWLTRRWSLAPDRVVVVRHGLERADAAEPARPEAVPQDLEPGGFLFTAGSLRPARGLEDAIGALEQGGSPLPLVVAGAADPDTRRFAARLQRRAGAPRVRWVGTLDAAGVRWAMRHAAAFVMTSRAEACPNTALEAMAEGALIVSTDRPPMPEFFGEAVRYYRACDAASLAGALRGLAGAASDARAAQRAAALARAGGFDWDETVRRTVDVLEGVRA